MHILLLIFAIILCTSCNGQVEPKSTTTTSTLNLTSQPKLITHHISNKFQHAGDNVHCGLQDRNGNLWFGTTGDGVYRYDGTSFTNFTIKDGLSSDQVLSILEDKAGNIWFGSRNGVSRFDGKSISKVPITATQRGLFPSVSLNQSPNAGNAVWSIMQDQKGTIWFGTDEGVYCYDGKTFTRFLDNLSIRNEGRLTLKSVQHMLEDSKGNIWFGSGPLAFEGICFYDGKKLVGFKPKNQEWVRQTVEKKDGVILFATRHAGVLYYEPSAKEMTGEDFHTIPAPPTFVKGSLTSLLDDKQGNLWMASDYGRDPGDTLGGAWRSNKLAGKVVDMTFTKFANQEVFFMLQDKDNNIWFGTRSTGLYRYDGKTLIKFSE